VNPNASAALMLHLEKIYMPPEPSGAFARYVAELA
jgi:hypothetical protein